MQIPKITRDMVSKLNDLTVAVTKAEEYASELLRTAQDRFNHVEEDVERDGKQIKLTRKVLWDEVFYLADTNCPAAQILKKHHPEVFEAYDVQGKAAEELFLFCKMELGFDYTKMRIRDYVLLTEATFAMLWEEKEGALVERLKAELKGA